MDKSVLLSVVCGPATSASPGSLLEILKTRPYLLQTCWIRVCILFYFNPHQKIWGFCCCCLFLMIWEREAGRERNLDLWFHLLMLSVVASWMCPDGDQTHPLGVPADAPALSSARASWECALLYAVRPPGCGPSGGLCRKGTLCCPRFWFDMFEVDPHTTSRSAFLTTVWRG